ncbi:hypothetical protein [uncultured Acidaminococcus sp.]|uniref:hypothetical protein n=1 Tax=uncultured Acidaminococcus sp. TaxID=352152 RepID=UPI0025935911|nr:hypothetical protein [uncultured Acidaminococcus sp.]
MAMDDDLFYNCCVAASNRPYRDLLEQLAEESAALSQAALKLIRARGISQRPTPISEDEALASLKKEALDVLIILLFLGLKEKKEAANGCAE